MEWVGEAGDGPEAIRAVHTLQPDLLLMDIKLPRMSGLNVLQYLRNEKNPVAIIFLSVHAEAPYVDAAMRLGADAFVAMQAGVDVLVATIRAFRDGHRY